MKRNTVDTTKNWEKVLCDRCGFTYRDGELREQDGIMVCDRCWDEKSYKDNKRRAS